MADTAYLIDGTYELFRMFFGAPDAQDDAGNEIGATRALLRSFANLLAKPGVTHVGVAFDHEIRSFRNDLFDGYKTGEGIEPTLLSQFPLAERVTKALGMTTWPMVEFEADDAIASAAAQLLPHVDSGELARIVIASPDKDLCQCVRGDMIVSWDRRKDVELDEAGVRAKFGVGPSSIPDYLALVGDSADGIPGIPRWGAKGTAAVLARYEKLEHIPDDASEWDLQVRGAASLAQNLASARKDALLYRELATLRVDAVKHLELETLRWKGPVERALDELCAELSIDVPTF